ncbi:hypothetical protein SOQ14_12740 [Erythrobacter sp. T5W1-R]|uniref:hypothetical protein n=1 Tax=Erythrobacter sp. T5W1-R TaxID=3101752 RepID=UPI002AFF1BF1|nr:hypothetical protein [Erythrobacter sp. T5W1-R]MEA1619783.1 hypothetical protein [Erythrobacter sp. T5W1-R]
MKIHAGSLFGEIPQSLRDELLGEYQQIVTNYYEGGWGASELSAGRFCEVAYTIIRGRADGSYPLKGAKPHPFDQKCRALETETRLERGLRLLAARILPALYEIRNNRDSGHVGAEVNSNQMDSSFALSASSWILGELIRVFHNTTTELAEEAVRQISEIRTPAIWTNGSVRRVLKDGLKLEEEILLLVASSGGCSISNLADWSGNANRSYILKILKKLHDNRLVEAADLDNIHSTPKAAAVVRELIER